MSVKVVRAVSGPPGERQGGQNEGNQAEAHGLTHRRCPAEQEGCRGADSCSTAELGMRWFAGSAWGGGGVAAEGGQRALLGPWPCALGPGLDSFL